MSNRSKHQQRIDQCMIGWSQATPQFPTMPSEKARILRARLIMEECLETINKGLGVRVQVQPNDEDPDYSLMVLMRDLVFRAENEPDLIELADGCADISVVTIGTLSAAGIADKPLLKEVDKNNLLKIATGHLNPVTGKFEKHPDHPAPDIAGVLEAQCLGEIERVEQDTSILWEKIRKESELDHEDKDMSPTVTLSRDALEKVRSDERAGGLTFEEVVQRIDRLLGLVDLGVSERALSELRKAWEQRPAARPAAQPPEVEELVQKVELADRIHCGKSWCSESMPCSECSGAERKLF